MAKTTLKPTDEQYRNLWHSYLYLSEYLENGCICSDQENEKCSACNAREEAEKIRLGKSDYVERKKL